MPEEPSVLSNLGLSYMLTRELPQAEETLRRAYGNPRADGRVRQNLALVVGLQGRFAEAETIAKGDLPADEAATNVAYLREMLSRKDKDNSRRRQQEPFRSLRSTGRTEHRIRYPRQGGRSNHPKLFVINPGVAAACLIRPSQGFAGFPVLAVAAVAKPTPGEAEVLARPRSWQA